MFANIFAAVARSSDLTARQRHLRAWVKVHFRRKARHDANAELAQELRQPDALRLYAPIATTPMPSPSAPTFEGATAFCAGRVICQSMPVVKVRRHRRVDFSQGEF